MAKERKKNLYGKTRPVEKPYEIWKRGDWEWRVLKKWQLDDKAPYARAYCAVRSPMTYDEWEYGDTYIADYSRMAMRTYIDPLVAADAVLADE